MPLALLRDVSYPYRLRLWGSLFATLVAALSFLAIGNSLRVIVNHIYAPLVEQTHSFAFAFGTLSIFVAILIFSTYVRIYLFATFSECVAKELRRKIFMALLGRLSSVGASEINVWIGQDVLQVQFFLNSVFPVVIRALFVVVGGIILLCLISPLLTLILYSFFFLSMAILWKFLSRHTEYMKESREIVKYFRFFVEEAVDKKYPNRRLKNLFDKKNHSVFVQNTLLVQNRALGTIVVIFFIFLGLIGISFLGALEISIGQMTSGDLTAFIFYSLTISVSIVSVTDLSSDFERTKAVFSHFSEIISSASDVKPSPHKCAPLQEQGSGSPPEQGR